MQKEEIKFSDSCVFEGMTSIRAIIKSIDMGISDRHIEKILYDESKIKKISKEIGYFKAVSSKYGFELIGQMMVGLPGADTDSECQTAREICAMGASGARVYPTVVFKGTELFDMTECGVYSPLDTDEAVMRTKNVLAVFAEHRLPVIRVGLCASENLASDDAVAGATHSAIGELAMGELYYDIICRELNGLNVNGGRTVIAVPRGEISKAVGQKRKNTLRLRDVYRTSVSFREDDELDINQIKIISYIPEGRTENCI